MKAMQEFIEKLELTPHVEGGYFKETYRSETLHTIENGKQRSLATLIYFLLPHGNYSKFHKIESDEIWIYQAGSPLLIHMIDNEGKWSTATSKVLYQLKLILHLHRLEKTQIEQGQSK